MKSLLLRDNNAGVLIAKAEDWQRYNVRGKEFIGLFCPGVALEGWNVLMLERTSLLQAKRLSVYTTA